MSSVIINSTCGLKISSTFCHLLVKSLSNHTFNYAKVYPFQSNTLYQLQQCVLWRTVLWISFMLVLKCLHLPVLAALTFICCHHGSLSRHCLAYIQYINDFRHCWHHFVKKRPQRAHLVRFNYERFYRVGKINKSFQGALQHFIHGNMLSNK